MALPAPALGAARALQPAPGSRVAPSVPASFRGGENSLCWESLISRFPHSFCWAILIKRTLLPPKATEIFSCFLKIVILLLLRMS